MTAREAMSITKKSSAVQSNCVVEEGMHLLDVLPRLVDSPRHELAVRSGSDIIGVIDETSLLEAFSHQLASRTDSSVIEISCVPNDYSASRIAHAVEDADVHLVDLLTSPAEDGKLRVTLRVRCEDSEGVVHSLERYGYEVIGSYSNKNLSYVAAIERMLELQALINV